VKYTVKATNLDPYEHSSIPYGHVVYEGTSFSKAKDAFLKHTAFGGVMFTSERD